MWYDNMILHPNHIITVMRGKTYETEVLSNIEVYIYEQSDSQDAMSGFDWAQNEQRMLSNTWWIQNRDKIILDSWDEFIVKKVKFRNSVVSSFYEIQIRETND